MQILIELILLFVNAIMVYKFIFTLKVCLKMELLLVIFAVFNALIVVNDLIIAQLAKAIEELELDLKIFLNALAKMVNMMIK